MKQLSVDFKRFQYRKLYFLTAIELEIENAKVSGKSSYIWKLNNALLKNHKSVFKIKEKIITYFELNESENTWGLDMFINLIMVLFSWVCTYAKSIKL